MNAGKSITATDAIQLIERTYAATLNPEQLDAFEDCWEAYVDSQVGATDKNLNPFEIERHIKLALDIIERVDHSRTSDFDARKIVNQDSGLRLVIDDLGAIVAANQDAHDVTQGSRNISNLDMDFEGKSRIQAWISDTERNDRNSHLFVHAYLAKPERKVCLFLTQVDFESQEDPARRFFLVTKVDLKVGPEVLPSIRSTYGLSAAEADITMRLANGETPKEISTARQSSIHTVRTQIKQVLQKTDSRNISDMVRIFTGISARFESVRPNEQQAMVQKRRSDGLLRKGGFTLSDGRFMEYLEQGHPNGRPVLLIHSLITDVGLSQDCAKQAALNGLRFITLIRAGYGDSDPNPASNLDQMLDQAVDDMRAFCRHLGIDRATLVSGWGGCFAQRFAIRYPDMVEGILQLRIVPVWYDSYVLSSRPRYRNIVKTSIHMPQVVPYLAGLGKVLIDTGREQVFASGVNRGRPVDLKALKDEDIFQTVARGYRVIVKQGVATFAEDLKTVHTDWESDAKQLIVPVTILVEPEYLDAPKAMFDRYMQIVPQARLKHIEGAGEYLYMTHFGDVLSEIEKFRVG